MVLHDAETGQEVDHVDLQDYETKPALRALFEELGFEKKNDEELEEMRRIKEEYEAEEERKRRERLQLIKEQTAKRREERVKLLQEQGGVEALFPTADSNKPPSRAAERQEKRRQREQARLEKRQKRKEEDALRREAEKLKSIRVEL